MGEGFKACFVPASVGVVVGRNLATPVEMGFGKKFGKVKRGEWGGAGRSSK